MRVVVVFSFMALVLAATPVFPDGGEERTLLDRLTRIADDRIAADGVAGAVIVLIEGRASVWTGAIGMADPAVGRPMAPDAVFRVESISKPVTAWGALRLRAARSAMAA